MLPMTKPAEMLLEEAKRLSPEERAMVAEGLLETLDPEADVDVEAAWAAEVVGRAEEAERDPSVLVEWDDVKRQVEEDLRRR